MPLYIRDDRIKALAEEVARLKGTTMTEAVRVSLAEAKERIEADRRRRRERAERALRELRSLGTERIDESILYDEQGNPVL